MYRPRFLLRTYYDEKTKGLEFQIRVGRETETELYIFALYYDSDAGTGVWQMHVDQVYFL